MAAEPQAPTGLQNRDLRSVLRVVGRAWWLVVGLAVLTGISTVVIQGGSPTIYESRSVVTAVSTPIPVENFEIAVTLFATDDVIGPVADALGIDASTHEVLATETLEAEWVSGGGLVITGRSTQPEAAVDLANLAAESFATTLEDRDLGSFAVLSARSSSVSEAGDPVLDAAAGAALGALLGLGLLVAGFLIRQPIVSEQDALAEFPADRAYWVHMRLGSGASDLYGSEAVALPLGIEAALIRDASLEGGGEHGDVVCCLLFEKSRRGDPAVRHLLAKMNVLDRWSPEGKHRKYWIRPEVGVQAEALEQARTVFLMVSEGSRRGPLHEVAEEIMVLTSRPTWILVYVTRGRLGRLAKSSLAKNSLLRRLVPLRRRPSRDVTH